MSNFNKSITELSEELQKAKAAVGSVATWADGKQYKKVSEGKWEPDHTAKEHSNAPAGGEKPDASTPAKLHSTFMTFLAGMSTEHRAVFHGGKMDFEKKTFTAPGGKVSLKYSDGKVHVVKSMEKAYEVLEDTLEKSKYIKRTGIPGHYKYVYPEDQNKPAGGQLEKKEEKNDPDIVKKLETKLKHLKEEMIGSKSRHDKLMARVEIENVVLKLKKIKGEDYEPGKDIDHLEIYKKVASKNGGDTRENKVLNQIKDLEEVSEKDKDGFLNAQISYIESFFDVTPEKFKSILASNGFVIKEDQVNDSLKFKEKKSAQTPMQKQISDKNPRAFAGYSAFHNTYQLHFHPNQITYKEFDTLDSNFSKNMEKYKMSRGSFTYANDSADVYFKTKEGLVQFLKDFNIKEMPIPEKEYVVTYKDGMKQKSIEGFYDKHSSEQAMEKIKGKYPSAEIKTKNPVLLEKVNLSDKESSLHKAADSLFDSLEKARITKYIKRVPKPSGKGYYYFYNRQQIKDYKEKGIVPKQKEGEHTTARTGIMAAYEALADFFGFAGSSDEGKFRTKIQEEHTKHKSKLEGIDVSDFARYSNEYLTNKDKWDKKLSAEKKESSPKAGEHKAEKKEPAGEKKESSGGSGFKLSIMRTIAGLYGNSVKSDKKVDYQADYERIKAAIKKSDNPATDQLLERKTINELKMQRNGVRKEDKEALNEFIKKLDADYDKKYSEKHEPKSKDDNNKTKAQKEMEKPVKYDEFKIHDNKDNRNISFENVIVINKKDADGEYKTRIYANEKDVELGRPQKTYSDGQFSPVSWKEKDSKSADNFETMPDKDKSPLATAANKLEEKVPPENAKETESSEHKMLNKKDYPESISTIVPNKEFSRGEGGDNRQNMERIISKKDIKGGFEIFGEKFFIAKDHYGTWQAFEPKSGLKVGGSGKTIQGAIDHSIATVKKAGAEKLKEAINRPKEKLKTETIKPERQKIEKQKGLKMSGMLETEIKDFFNTYPDKFPEFKKELDWYMKTQKPEKGMQFSTATYAGALQNMQESIEDGDTKRIEKYTKEIQEYRKKNKESEDKKNNQESAKIDAKDEAEETEKNMPKDDQDKYDYLKKELEESKDVVKDFNEYDPGIQINVDGEQPTINDIPFEPELLKKIVKYAEEWSGEKGSDDNVNWSLVVKSIAKDKKKLSIAQQLANSIVENGNYFPPKITNYFDNKKKFNDVKEKLMGPKMFKATQLLLSELAKAKAMPVGTISKSGKYKKTADGQWTAIKHVKGDGKSEEKPAEKTDKKEEKKPEKKGGMDEEKKGVVRNALKKMATILADALSMKDVNSTAAGAVEESGEHIKKNAEIEKKKKEKNTIPEGKTEEPKKGGK